jgi:hypothetical protein
MQENAAIVRAAYGLREHSDGVVDQRGGGFKVREKHRANPACSGSSAQQSCGATNL